MFKKYLLRLWHHSAGVNEENIISCLEKNPEAQYLELGCHFGDWAVSRGKAIGTRKPIFGVDINDEYLKIAESKGLKVFKADVNYDLPFEDNFFDCLTANQIIEHLIDVDKFLEEVFRILKPGGYLVISTENLSSWHNIFALLFGFQAFSQDLSAKKNIANPFKLCQIKKGEDRHRQIFTLRGLKEILQLYHFQIERVLGAGYYPLPPFLSKIFSFLDPYRAPFITIKARKPKK